MSYAGSKEAEIRPKRLSQTVFVTAQGVFFVSGGVIWMLCYSLSLPLLHNSEQKVEATRLLNLMTQVGILIGIGISLLAMDLVHTHAPHTESMPKTYACQGSSGQCVLGAGALPLSECEQACGPAANYTCDHGACVVSATGLPRADCAQVCGGPTHSL